MAGLRQGRHVYREGDDAGVGTLPILRALEAFWWEYGSLVKSKKASWTSTPDASLGRESTVCRIIILSAIRELRNLSKESISRAPSRRARILAAGPCVCKDSDISGESMDPPLRRCAPKTSDVVRPRRLVPGQPAAYLVRR